MNELGILLSFLPLSLLALPPLERLQSVFCWGAIVMALTFNLFLLYPNRHSLEWWLPYAAFFAVVVFEMVKEKKLRLPFILGALFIGHALLCKNLTVILMLLLFSDIFLSAEKFPNPGLQGLLISLTSLLPVAGGVLLGLQGPAMTYCIAATIVFRLASWPFLNLAVYLEERHERFLTCMSLVSAFLLWRTQNLQDPAWWAVIWVGIAAFFSIGSRPLELLGFMSLGLFSISPIWGLWGMCLWPLSLYQGKNNYLLTVLMTICGAFVTAEMAKALPLELALAAATVCGLLSARIFVLIPEEKVNLAVEAVGAALAIGIGVGISFLQPGQLIPLEMPSIAFAGGFVFIYTFGKIISVKRPRFFKPMKNWGRLTPFGEKIRTVRYAEAESPLPPGKVVVLPSRFFNALDSEANVVLLLGVLGLLLFWRLP